MAPSKLTRLHSLEQLHRLVVRCELCPRLRNYCRAVAQTRRRAYAEWDYWGRPVPGVGDPAARIWIIGLAPAAHGGNRTGRVFTGDRSGDFLYAALYRAGLANQATSISRDDGLVLRDCYISAAARCAPPGNRPLPTELAACSRYLDAEWRLLAHKRVILALGKIAWDAARALALRNGVGIPSRVAFGHGAIAPLGDGLHLLGSYHVSQQNTFTGKLTPLMFDEVLGECLRLARHEGMTQHAVAERSRHRATQR
jgi:uracil-DNA glycosylase family 4